jgi:hypothetical protein
MRSHKALIFSSAVCFLAFTTYNSLEFESKRKINRIPSDISCRINEKISELNIFKSKAQIAKEVQNVYNTNISKIHVEQEVFQEKYAATSSIEVKKNIVTNARDFLYNSIVNDVLPSWSGTEYDYNGSTKLPLEGKIACGYFVSTTLEQVGFNIHRGKMARAASLYMIQSLASKKSRVRFATGSDPGLDLQKILDNTGNGLYQVGIDTHTGYIISDDTGDYFCHVGWDVVKRENIHSSNALKYGAKKGMWLGKLLDDNMMRAWLTKSYLPLKDKKIASYKFKSGYKKKI